MPTGPRPGAGPEPETHSLIAVPVIDKTVLYHSMELGIACQIVSEVSTNLGLIKLIITPNAP